MLLCWLNRETGSFVFFLVSTFLSLWGQIFHIRIVSSPAALAIVVPSGDFINNNTLCVWPFKSTTEMNKP